MKPTLVVISHYNAWPTDDLIALLDQTRTIPRGPPVPVPGRREPGRGQAARIARSPGRRGDPPPREPGIQHRGLGTWVAAALGGRRIPLPPGRMPDHPARLGPGVPSTAGERGDRPRRREPDLEGRPLGPARRGPVGRRPAQGSQLPQPVPGRPDAHPRPGGPRGHGASKDPPRPDGGAPPVAHPGRPPRGPGGGRRLHRRPEQAGGPRRRGGHLAGHRREGARGPPGLGPAVRLHHAPPVGVS